MSGWIKIHRSLREWRFYKDKNMLCLWIHLLLNAEFEDVVVDGEVVERGSLCTSQSELQRAVGLTRQEVRTCLLKLESNQQITIKSTKKTTKITICNFESYQDLQPRVQPTKQPKTNQQTASLPPEPPISYIKEERRDNARTRENWRHLSSARLDQLRVSGTPVAEFKRSLLREEVEAVASELGLTKTDVDAFVQKWGESSPGSDRIRAEYEVTFDVRERAKNYKGVGKPVSRGVTVQELMRR